MLLTKVTCPYDENGRIEDMFFTKVTFGQQSFVSLYVHVLPANQG